jgi:serine/threonine protein kinase
MKLPALVDYQQAVQAPSVAFLDDALRRGRLRLNPLGIPAVSSGGFALTFDVTVDGHRYAIRCFHKQSNHRQERYTQISEFIRSASLDFLVAVDYLPDGIRVGEQVFPIVRMPWVKGSRLNDWLDDHLADSDALDRVRRHIADAVRALRQHKVAHGDIQHGNILVTSDDSIRLIDYDGMYLPDLRHYGAADEQGNRNYQHPERSSQYDDSLDLFAAHVVDLSLAAIAHDPRLWKEFNSGENLLFSSVDFASPQDSPVFRRLESIPALAEKVRRLRQACQSRFDAVPAVLMGIATQSDTESLAQRREAASAATADAVRATDRATLIARQGDQVTVIGRIVATNTVQGRRGGTITFLNFGNHRRGDFTVVAWDRGSRDLAQTYGGPAKLVDRWVSVTGLLTIYQRPGTRTLTPQIELQRARSLRTLTAGQAATLLARHPPDERSSPPAATRKTPPAPRPSTAVPPTTTASAAGAASTTTQPGGATTPPARSDIDARLGKLYSSPTFSSQVSTPGSPPRPSVSGPAPSPKPARTSGAVRPPTTPTKPAARQASTTPPSSSPPAPPPAAQPPPRRRAPQYIPTTPLPPPQRHPYPAGTAYPPTTPFTSPYYPARPPTGQTGLGVAALVVAFFFGPAGVAMAIAALSRGRRQSEADRVCAWLALVVGGLTTLICICSIFTSVLQYSGSG